MSTQVNKDVAKVVKYYSDNHKKIIEKYNELIKWVGASSLAFLPFFVSLIPDNPLHNLLLGLYISVVVSIGLGLLSVCIILFGQLKLENLLLIQATQALAKPHQENKTHDISSIQYPFYYKVAKTVFLLSYTIFFISFISFCILIAI